MNTLRSLSSRFLLIAGSFTLMVVLSCCDSVRPSSFAAPRSEGAATRSSHESRPGLGTSTGGDSYSHVDRVTFYRKSSGPDAIASFHYNDEEGAKAMAERVGSVIRRTGLFDLADNRLRAGLVKYGDEAFPSYEAHDKHFVIGESGHGYDIRIENRTSKRMEVIVSVDSLNVLTGSTAGYSQRGYILRPKQAVNIDGFRVTNDKVKSFRFGTVADSKAAKNGAARNVGVVGLAVFEEDEVKARLMLDREQDRRQDADAFPAMMR